MYYKLHLENQVDGLSEDNWTLKTPAVLGRDPECQVCIDHGSISRQHCEFSLNSSGALVVRDLESMNGTYVNNNKVDQAILMPGQVVQVGALRLQIDFSATADDMNDDQSEEKGSVYTTQPMETFNPVPIDTNRPWWKKIFG